MVEVGQTWTVKTGEIFRITKLDERDTICLVIDPKTKKDTNFELVIDSRKLIPFLTVQNGRQVNPCDWQ